MRLRNLFTPSFRNRLRLFFVVIVVIPMIAVALVLFQIVTRSEESQTDAQLSRGAAGGARTCTATSASARERGRAGRSSTTTGLREAIADEDPSAIERAPGRRGARRPAPAACCSTLDGPGTFEFGDEPGVAPARNAIVDQDGKPLGRIVTVGRQRHDVRDASSRTSPRSAS